MNAQPPPTVTRTDWLNLTRQNAAVCGDDANDLGKAILRLATLAAAAHRAQDAYPHAAAASAPDATTPEWPSGGRMAARGSV